jgi:hypothetical protein
MSAVPDDILLDLAHADDHIIKHLSHQDALLRVHHLVEGILQVTIDLQVTQVESPIVLEPFVIGSFVC